MMNEASKFIDYHITQAYGQCDYQIPFDSLRKRYESLPNEAVYVVDCKTAQLEPLTKRTFARLIGAGQNHKNELYPLYEHVSNRQLEPFFTFTTKVMKTGFLKNNIDPVEEGDWASCIYKNEKGTIILKSTAVLKKDSKGLMRYSVVKLTDITGLVKNGEFSYRCDGPNSDLLFAVINDLAEMKSLLSRRELEVLAFIGKGMKSKQIADRLYISKHTVDTHRRNIIEKLETNGTIQAYNKAKDIGLL